MSSRNCANMDIKVRIALGETTQAWKLGWQLFEHERSFRAFQELQELHDELGQPEPELLIKLNSFLLTPKINTNAMHSANFISALANQMQRSNV